MYDAKLDYVQLGELKKEVEQVEQELESKNQQWLELSVS
jgi:hypothetical protein